MTGKMLYDKSVLSASQREAVTHFGGPLLVLAGPGSGKTFVITRRIEYLIAERKVAPENILVLTFSKAAALEMQERFLKRSGNQKSAVTFGTFHAFFFQILRTSYGYTADQVAGEDERVAIVSNLVREKHMESGDFKTFVKNILSEIASVKEERAELSHYYAVHCPAERFREIFSAYESALGALHKIDYEDMLLMTYELLSKRPDICAAIQKRRQWILVDEFQDINRLQYEIVRMIAGKRANLTVVGDDDQSIYRFRGAKPEIMLGFRKDYPDAKQVVLNINYRSTPEIVKTAGRLIRKNKRRFEKQIEAKRNSGKPVNTVVCPDPPAESAYIIREIRRRVGEGMHYGDIAVLYRTNLQPRLLIAKLLENNIPFRLGEMLPNLMDHWISADLCAYLRLANHCPLPGDLLRIMNRPNRYIRRDAVRMEGESIEGLKNHYEKSGEKWMLFRLERLERALRMLARKTVFEGIRFIRLEMGYDDFLKTYAKEHEIELEELTEILDEVQDSAEGFQTMEAWFSHCENMREALIQKREKEKECLSSGREREDAVCLMTFHASKGLEFPVVFLLDLNEGIVPHRKAFGRDELEEERRMFYVAMTRAKDELILCTCKRRFSREAEESRFVREYENR